MAQNYVKLTHVLISFLGCSTTSQRYRYSMSIAAAANTNKVLSEIMARFKDCSEIDDFSKLRFLKEADSQPTLERMHTLKAMIYTLSGDKSAAKEHAITALRTVDDPATIDHCLRVLLLNCYAKTAIEQVKLLQNFLVRPEYISSFGLFFVSLPNVFQMERVMDVIFKGQLEKQHESLVQYFNFIFKTIDMSVEQFNLDKGIFDTIVDLAAGLSEEYQVVLNSTVISIPQESEAVSVVFNVEADDVNQVVDLNWALADSLIEKDLDALPFVARFEAYDIQEHFLRNSYYVR